MSTDVSEKKHAVNFFKEKLVYSWCWMRRVSLCIRSDCKRLYLRQYTKEGSSFFLQMSIVNFTLKTGHEGPD